MSEIFSRVGIDPGIIIILLMVSTIGLIIVVMHLHSRINQMNVRYRHFMKGEDGKSLEKGFIRRFSQVEDLLNSQHELADDMKLIDSRVGRTLYKYGIVKYDAFDDVGGKLSFALAMLDGNNTGFVLNAIHSKDNCFLYIKEVVAGESYIMLSNEEMKALQAASRFGEE
ncbi:MAG: DUF4446 family protein [Lachnospiraceae bacterium]|jgi:hypothetical protein|nr:DUF4446 family protein [Lachnospiraceae bacterium]MBR6399293.1 DUF4446 family protein [Lachnospiraceae bacterium]MBR7015470.1 DUF4446 family protein [Lachnospiraceae bacterium]MEE3377950.1 DUF4446 family protein [Lachnospiraceae bacterium]MEE3438240.1 DUF4446 family protein [Lachnospiraceae bacterium]